MLGFTMFLLLASCFSFLSVSFAAQPGDPEQLSATQRQAARGKSRMLGQAGKHSRNDNGGRNVGGGSRGRRRSGTSCVIAADHALVLYLYTD